MRIVEKQLSLAHLEHLVPLEERFPAAFRHGREGLRAKLATLREIKVHMSWILFEGATCVAYIIVYPRVVKLGDEEEERILYVDDIYTQPGRETLVFRLLKLATDQAKRRRLGDLAIEAYSRAGAYQTFTRHDALFRKYGWTNSGKHEYWDDRLGEEMCWLRWDKYYETSSTIATGDTFRKSREEADDFDEPAKKLVTLEDSEQYAYRPKAVIPIYEPEDDVDEFDALTQVMLGAEDEDLVEIVPAPPVSRTADVFGIQEFFGTRPRAKREKIIRRPSIGL